MKKRARKRIRVIVVAVVCLEAVANAAAVAGPDPACSDHSVPVEIDPAAHEPLNVWGELCLPAAGVPDTVQLLMAGSTANHLYWDFPFKPERYSYVRALTAAGVATFNLDRLGTGNSQHPPSPLVTTRADISIAHQLVGKLRDGKVGGHRFRRVVVGGHSHGAVVALLEATRYRDVDGLVVAGVLHNVNVPNVALAIATTVMPCAMDGRLAKHCPDPGYITYGPEMRRKWIHDASADPRVVELDEQTKDVTTVPTEVTEGELVVDTVLGAGIDVPVLIAVGERDLFMCGPAVGATDCSSTETVSAAEAPYYGAAPSMDVVVVPDAGHEINLEKHARVFFKTAADWARQRIR